MSYTTVVVNKAQGTGRRPAPPGVRIVATLAFPDDLSIEESRRRHETDAARIASALLTTLPGGTLDRLLLKLLSARACDLIVPVVSTAIEVDQ